MKNIKRFFSLVLAFVVVLSIIPAVSIKAESGTIKKTTKKKYVIKNFDDQDKIDELGEFCGALVSEYVDFINERGGWYGVTEDYTWKLDKKKNYYVPKYKDGIYLDPLSLSGIRPKMQDHGSMTIAQAARSLKNMYGKYACVTKAELKSDDEPLTTYWIEDKVIKIARKRHNPAFASLIESSHKNTPEKGWNLTKAGYAYFMTEMISSDAMNLMDPMYDHEYNYD